MHFHQMAKSLSSSIEGSFPSLCLVLTLIMLRPRPSATLATFVFGDSLVDAGNNDYILTLSKADSPPYGIDFGPSGGRPTGRFTNGRTISDVIGRIPLGKQISYFEQTRAEMVGMMGENATIEFLKGAIFSITTGSNDLLNFLEPSIPFFGGIKVSPTTLQDTMASNFTLHLKRLHELGARKFIVVAVGPLGCIPYVHNLMLMTNAKCSPVANRLVQGYNMKLKKVINRLNGAMGPYSMFVYANSYDIALDIITNYNQYGFENANDPCCGVSFPPFLCIKGANDNNSSVFCEDRSKYVFWDAYHPTQAANIIIAKKLIDGDADATSPINIRRLYGYDLS